MRTRFYQCDQAGVLVIRVRLGFAENNAELFDTIESCMRCATRVGQLGGLAGAAINPRNSSLSDVVVARPSADELCFAWTSVHVDPAAARYLLNSISGVAGHRKDLETELILPFDWSENRISSNLVEFNGPTPFKLTMEVEGRSLVVALEFQDKASVDQCYVISQSWLAWLECCASGMFGDEECPPSHCLAVASDQEVMTSPSEMRMTCIRLLVGPAAIACLVNNLAGIHHRVVGIADVIMS